MRRQIALCDPPALLAGEGRGLAKAVGGEAGDLFPR